MTLAVTILAAYLIGSLPFAVLVANRCGIDILSTGSGNPGASNVYRSCGLKAALVVLFLDVLKGFVPALAAGHFHMLLAPDGMPDPQVWMTALVGTAAVLGHVLPIYTRFYGGKGVATIGGVIIALAPLAASATLAVWIGTFLVRRTFSVASLTGALAFPFAVYLFEGERDLWIMMWGLMVPLVVFITHRDNIRRLIESQEFGFRRPHDEDEP
ncbi:glycerol-3-phosphate 1-O-acyltransferase PlsY [bacterium]|nr:glycerol-3-phosphate 1-O-acyltransferase PlsY [bacterium]